MTDDNGSKQQRLPDVGAYIRDQRRKAQLSLRKLAERSGVSNPYLSQIERGLRQPSAKILKGIATALEVSAETLFTQAGILDGGPEDVGESGVLRSIFRDPELTDGQRRELAETYERFRSETAERRARRQVSEGFNEANRRGGPEMSAIERGLYVTVGAADLAAEKVRELPAVKFVVERTSKIRETSLIDQARDIEPKVRKQAEELQARGEQVVARIRKDAKDFQQQAEGLPGEAPARSSRSSRTTLASRSTELRENARKQATELRDRVQKTIRRENGSSPQRSRRRRHRLRRRPRPAAKSTS